MCCRRRRPPRCWSPGGPTPPSELAPQPPEHCPGNRETEIFEMLNQSDLFDLFFPYHSIGISESVTYHFHPFPIFKAKTSETLSQTVCSLAAWLGESDKVLGDSGFGVCHYRLSLPPPHQGRARWIPLQSSPMDAALFQCNPGKHAKIVQRDFPKELVSKRLSLNLFTNWFVLPHIDTHTHTEWTYMWRWTIGYSYYKLET